MAVFYIQNSILCPLTLYPLKKSVRKGQNLSDGNHGDIGGYGGYPAI